MSTPDLHIRAGTLARDGFRLDLRARDAGWSYTSLRVLDLAAGEQRVLATDDEEVLVLSLGGAAVIDVEGERVELAGRPHVFAGLSDVVYVPPGRQLAISSEAGGRFALPGARAAARRPVRHVPATALPVELRGAGRCSRQVVNLGMPGTFDAERIMACEVYTPGGNWSSFPPHKHDEEREGETQLEEIYYFEVAGSPAGAPGVAYQRVYGTEERPIDVLAEVRSGDVVLIPHGWHGPSMATPGYDLYYLNVMAGPGAERAWRICLDADHRWVTETWHDEEVDPRLPLATARPASP
jgi:5-deoxy-glucuronate isomerase